MTKIDIISGFLGAGKTTFIKKMIDEVFKGEKIVLIENEFGEVGIDGGFLKDAGIQITEMNSGCICCSLVGDFGKNLHEVIDKYHPDRILIEPSGVGKLSDVMKSVIDIEKEEDVKLNGLVTVVNALKASKQMKAFGEFFNNQIANATTIVLSRTQNAKEEKLELCVKEIQAVNPKAAIITTPWDAITGEQILNVVEQQDSLMQEMMKEYEEHHHEHHHDHEHAHSHDHDHTGEHHHHHEHRGLPEILAIIRSGGLTPGARALAERIFQILAEAEAKAHGVPLDQVHFHEVGAVDSIVDIVAAAVCLDNLAPDEVIVTGLSEGSGFVRCQHGMIPVPVPAVLNIVQAHGLTLVPTGIQGELVTPTGAAIVAAIRTKETLPASFKCTRTGLGAGKRTYERPSLLRAMMLETEENDEKDTIWKLECNIDDCTGEALGYCMGKLLRSGARDVHYIPVYMKKNRPAYQLDVICDDKTRETLENIIFAETTTIGIRRCRMERTVMKREFATIATEYGHVTVKICRHGEIEKIYPEYESAAVIAEKSGMPVGEAGAWIVQKYKEGNKKA